MICLLVISMPLFTVSVLVLVPVLFLIRVYRVTDSMSLTTTIKVSREFRKKLKIAKNLDETYQEYLEKALGL